MCTSNIVVLGLKICAHKISKSKPCPKKKLPKAARYFSKLLDRKITESSTRRLTYVVAFAEAQLLHHKLATVKITKFKFRQTLFADQAPAAYTKS